MVKNQRTKQREQRSLGDCCQWKANGQCVKGDKCSFRHDINKRWKITPSNPSPNSFMQQSERKLSRTRSPRGKSPSGRMSRWPCKDYLRGTCGRMREMDRDSEVLEAEAQVGEWLDCCARIASKELAPLHYLKNWHPPECLFYKSENGCRFGEKCSYAHRQVDEQPSKRSKKNGDKSAVAMLKITRQLACVFQDTEPPKSSSILRKSSNIRKPIRCVRFTKAVVRHADIGDQNPSLGMIFPGDPHQRNPNAPKFEDRSQEETQWQERCAREAAWRLDKKILKLKEKQ